MLYAEQKDYEAVYEPLNCVGVAIDYEKMYIANWKFFPTGGSGSEIDIRYNNIKRRPVQSLPSQGGARKHDGLF